MCLIVNEHLQPARYITFNIGSVDAFERNLDQAQRELGIDSTHFIPVTYPADPNWLQKAFVSMLPTLIILGTLIYFSRRISGGTSGRGVRLTQTHSLYKFTAVCVGHIWCWSVDCQVH